MKTEDLFSLLFIASVMLAPYIVNFFQNYTPAKVVYIEVQQPVKKTKVKNKKPLEIKNPLEDDAIQCLTSLGMKKLDAIKKVKDMFQKKNYQSIESFLIDVYKK